ncbi:hypothetical protein BN1723_013298 [Verticillium longisporum]|uniref:Uncharacterized protein n=1 Tax=Verticillium longisporum TaxID=100787 RepID=A0A0G4LRZ5_VERLO|nr:hypothetical protein BN1723_013298 [Verticillium longisporum]
MPLPNEAIIAIVLGCILGVPTLAVTMMTWLEARQTRLGGLKARIELQYGDVELLRLFLTPGPQPQHATVDHDFAAATPAAADEASRSSGTDVYARERM